MKNFQNFLTEKKGEKAHKEAIAMGLQYKGFGYWVDPNTGETKFKTENDRLVPVDPEMESEMYKDDGEGGGAPPERGPGGGMSYGQMMGVQNTMQPQINAGENLGDAPPPGAEQAPNEKGWIAGPDGDHCVDSENPPGQIPQDSFVGRHNSLGWIAGPDGSYFPAKPNLNEEEESSIKYNPDRKQHAHNVGRRRRFGTVPDIKDRAETKFDASMAGRMGTDWMHGYMRRLGADPEKADPKLALHQSAMERLRDHWRKEQGKSTYKSPVTPETETGYSDDYEDSSVSGTIVPGPAAVQKDAERAKEMNDEIRGMNLFANPEFDMDKKGKVLGSGAFGTVSRGLDDFNGMGTIIKEGNIGPEELLVMKALQDHPMFPTLINAEFSGPFNDDSAQKNNPFGGQSRFDDEQGYFDPEDMDSVLDFSERFVSAPGRIAMTQIAGQPISSAFLNGEFYDEDGEQDMEKTGEMIKQVFAARAIMHRLGIAHQDMHGNNMFWDDENQKLGVLDFGLAKKDWRYALGEALGGFTDDINNRQNIGDYQLSAYTKANELPQYLRDRVQDNLENIEQMLMDNWKGDQDDEEAVDNYNYQIAEFLRGSLRKKGSELDELYEEMGIDEDMGMKIIEALYDRFEDPETPTVRGDMTFGGDRYDDPVRQAPKKAADIPMAPRSPSEAKALSSIVKNLFGR